MEQCYNASIFLLFGQHSYLLAGFGLITDSLQRPDLQPPAMNVTLHNKDLVTPGYVFIAPYQVAQAGPYIYDKLGVCWCSKTLF